MPQRLERVLRRVLEVVLVVAALATGYAAVRGQVSASTLGAIVSVLIALSVSVDHLNRGGGRRGRCLSRAGK